MAALANSKHELFAQSLAAGMSAVEAYKAAGYKPDRGAASRLSANVSIQGRVRELQEAGAAKVVMTLQEALMFASDVIRTPVGEINEKSPLAQEVTRDILTSEEGGTVTVREKIKLPSKLDALEKLAKFKGWFAPEKKEVAFTVNEERLAKLMGVEGA